MANREYNYAVGRRKETTATVKLYAKGAGNFVLKTATGRNILLLIILEVIITFIKMHLHLSLHSETM